MAKGAYGLEILIEGWIWKVYAVNLERFLTVMKIICETVKGRVVWSDLRLS